MCSITYKSKLVLKDRITEGYISIFDGVITYVGENAPTENFIEIKNGYIAPGFIDRKLACSTKFRMPSADCITK